MTLVQLFQRECNKRKSTHLLDNRRWDAKAAVHRRAHPQMFQTHRNARERIQHQRALAKAAVVFRKFGWERTW